MTILTDAQAQLLHDEKAYLAELFSSLSELKAAPSDLAALRDSLLRLDELFLIVVVGEFNSGKSTLINGLLGAPVLPEGVTPTTTRVTLVKYGETIQESAGADDLVQLAFPLDFLRELNIVDTPGTNAVIRKHEELTRDFIPRSDLVLFVTSADRPFTESERQFLDHIRDWGKKIILVINKRDILENEAAQAQVRGFVAENARQLLSFEPQIFFVSAKRDLEGPNQNGMSSLKQFVLSWLDERVRLSVKFSSPLGVADQVLRRSETKWKNDMAALQVDLETGGTVEREIAAYSEEMKDELEPRLSEVDNLLYRLEARGSDFFDQRMRLLNIAELARGDLFRARFEKEVLAGVPEEIEQRTRSTAEWLVEKDLRHWQQILAFMQRRRSDTGDQLVGDVTSSIDLRRQSLLNSVTESAQGVVSSYDAEKESRDIGAHVETAVAQTALVEAGAVGLGTLIATAVSAAAIDITGVLLAGVIAVVGFFIIPYKRKQAKERFRSKIEDLRNRLQTVLHAQFESEADRSLTRLKEGVAPYLRFVHAEKDRLGQEEQVVEQARTRLGELQARVDRAFK